MKCIRNTTNEELAQPLRRVSDTQAETLVKTGKWAYCSKQDWKKNVRDFGKSE
jgi:hypothetical protein